MKSGGSLISSRIKLGIAMVALNGFGFACSNPSIEEQIDKFFLPRFLSEPVVSVDHNREYVYLIEAADPQGDSLIFSFDAPEWLSFDPATKVLSGLASWENIGSHDVVITISDGLDMAFQSFTIEVLLGEIICDTDFGDPSLSPYILPYPVGKSYNISQSYCPPNPSWGHHNWFAYDFDLSIGDTIVAARAGLVTATLGIYEDANRTPGQENYIFILHDDGSVGFYVHLTRNGPLVRANDRVEQGQPIGLSGDTGASIGPHLHFVVFKERNKYSRNYSLPVNFRNAEGPLNPKRGLVMSRTYKALPFVPDEN